MAKIKRPRQQQFSNISDILSKFEIDRDKYISQEFQKYGYDLAKELGDMPHKALYIKLAKDNPRGILETAKNFVKDAYNAKSKARLFMWKLAQLNAGKDQNKKEVKKPADTHGSKD